MRLKVMGWGRLKQFYVFSLPWIRRRYGWELNWVIVLNQLKKSVKLNHDLTGTFCGTIFCVVCGQVLL